MSPKPNSNSTSQESETQKGGLTSEPTNQPQWFRCVPLVSGRPFMTPTFSSSFLEMCRLKQQRLLGGSKQHCEGGFCGGHQGGWKNIVVGWIAYPHPFGRGKSYSHPSLEWDILTLLLVFRKGIFFQPPPPPKKKHINIWDAVDGLSTKKTWFFGIWVPKKANTGRSPLDNFRVCGTVMNSHGEF